MQEHPDRPMEAAHAVVVVSPFGSCSPHFLSIIPASPTPCSSTFFLFSFAQSSVLGELGPVGSLVPELNTKAAAAFCIVCFTTLARPSRYGEL